MTISNPLPAHSSPEGNEENKAQPNVLLVDNFDSFTWNVYQSLCKLGAKVAVVRNDKKQAFDPKLTHLVISPGPGHPSAAGISNEMIKMYEGKIPILGVCLGQQCMYEIYGGRVGPCGELVHGKTTPLIHDQEGLFKGVSMNIECTRYHSLAGELDTLPEDLIVNCWTESGIVMGVRHKKYVIEGVQFHPESIASEEGDKLFGNFLSWSGGNWAELTLHPERVKVVTPEAESAVSSGTGIPLSQASKINSTSYQSTEKKSTSILVKIVNKRKQDLLAEKQAIPMEYLERTFSLGLSPSLISFPQRLRQAIDNDKVAVIAEIKRASPSKGDIDANVHAPQQALLYASGGAAAISVLTEPNWFKGTLEDLRLTRLALENVDNRPALLRKEFIFDKYQVLQSRLAGADTVLLIVAILTDEELRELLAYSRVLGMEPVVEVASTDEMKRAIDAKALVIGINNRDLNTFEVDMGRTSALSGMVDSGIILLALSGIRGRDDVERYMESGASGVLVGESIMRAHDQIEAVRELRGYKTSLVEVKQPSRRPLVKICGLTRLEDALVAKESGADFMGFIFAKESPRCVTPAKAKEIISSLKLGKIPPRTDCFKPTLTSTKTWFETEMAKLQKKTTPMTVGVFTDHSPAEINQITNDCGLDLIQLHKPKSPEVHRLLNRPVIQVVGISSLTGIDGVQKVIKTVSGSANFILLDTTTDDLVGGTGIKFDWSIVSKLGVPVWMAGGLTADNVGEAIKSGPVAVDVSSGVELDKGIKDHAKIKLFLANARG